MAGVLAAAGLALLFAGGEFVVRGAVALSRHLGLSRLLIGLVVVGFATSLPELVVSLSAAIEGRPGITVGNIIGSTNANLLLILGAAAAVAPIAAAGAWRHRTEALVMAAAVAALAAAALLGGLSRLGGAVFVAGLAAYLAFAYRQARRGDSGAVPEFEEESSDAMPLGRSVALVLGGLVALIAGGQALVTGAETLARLFGVPESVIGLTLVAMGTSFPELATTVVASARGHGELAVGNVLGSNIFNVLGILGLTALVRPLGFGPGLGVDVAVALGASLVLFPVLAGRARIGRLGGAALVAGYAAYVVTRFV